MTMKLAARQVGSVTVVDVSGRIVLGEDTALLRSTVKDLCAKGQKHILLNMAGATHIDSSGLGELVSSCVSARNQGGEIKLLKLTAKVQDVLQITKLYTVFDVFNDEAAAIKSFSK